MPLLSPSQIHEVLRAESPQEKKTEPVGISRILNKHNLSNDEIIENLSRLARWGENENVQLSATKTAAELAGLLNKDESGKSMSVTIVINDMQYATVNPILIPR